MLIPETGKWYAEVVFSSGGQHSSFGVINPIDGSSLVNLEFSTSQEQIRADNSYLESSTESWGNGNVLGIKVDRDAGTIQFTVDGTNASTAVNLSEMNNSSQLVFTTSRTEGGGAAVAGSFNFGQRPFSHLPTDYKSLCTANLDDPSINLPNKHFDTLLYTGNGTDNTDRTGLNFQPDLVWIKGRSAAKFHSLYDSVRGAGQVIYSSMTNGEGTDTGLKAFNSDGFRNGTNQHTNENATTYAAWNWNAGGSTVTNNDGSIESQVRANTTAGFSIVSYTGTGSTATIGHGLGVAPKVVIVKRRSAAEDWIVGIGPILGSGEEGHYVKLNSTAAKATGNGPFNSTNPSSSVVTLGTDVSTNGSSSTYISYCFSEVAGFSKFGKYSGNGNDNGTFVYTGFRPAYVVVKSTSGYSWDSHDSTRNPFNNADLSLALNLDNAESTYDAKDFLSNGFKLKSTSNSINKSGNTYVYLAFAESPLKYARAR